ncbi:uncharacterized protein LOC125940573 isoform X5 [Dermacentor silvarum]|uniref:uncharacterized protein LOC125940573 isoform X5 n=1 Tax=Dermacentor silvarum TaxID=543639 RepID=UPI002101AC54|nr:uncharacterized protein LOC125940573 isoform X5 [Dermacentor silvarum]
MAFWKYTLTGFNDFLEQRRVAFAEPMPASRVCSICGRLPSSTVLLPCGHALCEECRRQVLEGMECPYDGRAFTEGQLVRLRFELSDLEQLRVVCVVGGKKCATFAGKLCELKDHLRQCGSGEVKCAKCQRSVARDVAVDHYRQRCDGNAPQHSASDARVRRAVEEVRGIKDGLESLRQRAFGERGGDEDLVNEANDLVERLTSLDRALCEAQENASGVDREAVSLQSLTNKQMAPGPFRPASKPGVFHTICKFTNVYAARDLLSQNKKEHRISTEVYTLSGYTFKLDCKFSLSGSEGNEEVNVRIILFLYDGDWVDFVQWPFSKKVSLVIAHPRDETKDIRLTIDMKEFKFTKKPRPGGWNWGNWTEKKNWNDIELQGYVVKGTLYINVEFE